MGDRINVVITKRNHGPPFDFLNNSTGREKECLIQRDNEECMIKLYSLSSPIFFTIVYPSSCTKEYCWLKICLLHTLLVSIITFNICLITYLSVYLLIARVFACIVLGEVEIFSSLFLVNYSMFTVHQENFIKNSKYTYSSQLLTT